MSTRKARREYDRVRVLAHEEECDECPATPGTCCRGPRGGTLSIPHESRWRKARTHEEEVMREERSEVEKLVDEGAFNSLSASPSQNREEVMLHVSWSCYSAASGERHHMRRGQVTADLGFDRIPSPGFTSDEMEKIMFAAKMEALRCLRRRKKARKA